MASESMKIRFVPATQCEWLDREWSKHMHADVTHIIAATGRCWASDRTRGLRSMGRDAHRMLARCASYAGAVAVGAMVVLVAVPNQRIAAMDEQKAPIRFAQSAPPALDRPTEASPQEAVHLSYELGVGDRLRIKIYGREDLASELRVRTDGTIALPLLGTFRAVGRQPSDVEVEIGMVLARLSGKEAFPIVEVMEWRPVSAVGVVDKPGTYPFTPGMTVLHSLAAAGGFHRPTAATSLFLEASREGGQLRRNGEQLVRALARQARLQAEIEGKDKAQLPGRLVQVAGAGEAAMALAAENSVLGKRLASHQAQIESLEQQIALAESEILATSVQQERVHGQAQAAKAELDEMASAASRGLATRSRMHGLKRDAALLEGEARAVLARVAQVERVLAVLRRDRAMLDVTRKLQLEEELRAVQAEVRSHDIAVQTSTEVLQRIGGDPLRLSGSEPSVTYKIMRLNGDRHILIDAEETTLLRPGDLVRVTFAAAERQLPSWSASNQRLVPVP